MKLTKDIIQKRYNKYDERVIEYLINISKSLKEQNVNDEYYYCMFDLLVIQLHLYYSSCDQLMKLKDLTSEDNYKRLVKSPLIGVLQKCHSQILDIMQKLSISPIEKAKLKRLNTTDDDESAEELLNSLIN